MDKYANKLTNYPINKYYTEKWIINNIIKYEHNIFSTLLAFMPLNIDEASLCL